MSWFSIFLSIISSNHDVWCFQLIILLVETILTKYFYHVASLRYLESKPQHWRPDHSVQIKDIEDMNEMKMALYMTHTINFQNYGEKSSRRSELLYELKNIFEELGIKYRLLYPKKFRSDISKVLA